MEQYRDRDFAGFAHHAHILVLTMDSEDGQFEESDLAIEQLIKDAPSLFNLAYYYDVCVRTFPRRGPARESIGEFEGIEESIVDEVLDRFEASRDYLDFFVIKRFLTTLMGHFTNEPGENIVTIVGSRAMEVMKRLHNDMRVEMRNLALQDFQAVQARRGVIFDPSTYSLDILPI